MVGLFPSLHQINPLLPNEATAVKRDAEKWLGKHVPDISKLKSFSVGHSMEIFWGLWTITTPELINVDVDTKEGIWRIPFNPNHDSRATAAVAWMLVLVVLKTSRGKRDWSLDGEGVDSHAGDLFVSGPIFSQEYQALLRGEFPPTLLALGEPGPLVPVRPLAIDLDQFPGRPSTVQDKHDPPGMDSGLVPRPSPSRAHGHHGPRRMNRRMDHGMNRGMDRGMDQEMDLLPRPPQAVRHQARGPINIADSTSLSSSDSTSSTESTSDDESDGLDTRKKSKKGKAVKGKSKGKIHRGRISSSASEDEGEAPRRRKKDPKEGQQGANGHPQTEKLTRDGAIEEGQKQQREELHEAVEDLMTRMSLGPVTDVDQHPRPVDEVKRLDQLGDVPRVDVEEEVGRMMEVKLLHVEMPVYH
ncbi:MAG: hypothetical protein Q9224_006070 [Gallowayella concinna]